MDSLIVRFRDYIKSNSLALPSDKILLAVSGGVDSMVMLSMFADSGYDIGVAHCNFALRGEESDMDELMVKQQAEYYGVEHYNVRFDTAGEMERTGESVQVAARRLRYAWFEELCGEYGYNIVAIAHHADDSIETFFINLFRGTGLRGLTGISVVRGNVVRPLLFASRREILEYAHSHHIPYREDSSNRSTKYLRNKIRLGVVPMLKEISPRFTQIMEGNIKRLTDTQLFVSNAIDKLRTEVEVRHGQEIKLDLSKIPTSFPRGFVLYELLSTYGFKGDTVDALERSLSGGGSGKRFYSKDYVAYIDRGDIIVAPVEEGDLCEIEIGERDAKAYFGNSVLWIDRMDVDNTGSLSRPASIAFLDADKLSFPLTLRRWKDGDSFVPIGMEGRKKVSDFLIDEKVSMLEKQRQSVLESAGEVVWIVGRRIDDRYKITGATENVLHLTVEVV